MEPQGLTLGPTEEELCDFLWKTSYISIGEVKEEFPHAEFMHAGEEVSGEYGFKFPPMSIMNMYEGPRRPSRERSNSFV